MEISTNSETNLVKKTIEMGNCNIEELFDEILEEIFGYLDAENLKAAALVKRRWNDVISSSEKTMKKFFLKIEATTKETSIDEIFRSTRKHRNLDVHDCSLKSAIRILSKFDTSQVRDLIAWNLSQVDGADLVKFLSKTPLLTRALIYHDKFIEFDSSILRSINLTRLEFLHIGESKGSSTILPYIAAKNLEALNCMFDPSAEPLVEFLRSCTKLQRIYFQANGPTKHFENDDLLNANLKLAEISLIGYIFSCFKCENFFQFLRSQESTLTVLELYMGTKNFTFPFMKFVDTLNHLKKLKSLKIGDILPESVEGSDTIRQLHQLTTLGICPSKIESYDFATEFILKCPNIVSLHTSKLSIVPTNCQMLLELLVLSLTEATKIPNFPNLTVLNIHSDFDSNHLLSLVKICPKIESFHAKVNGTNASQIIDILQQSPTLRHLSIFGRDEHLKVVFERVKNGCGNLQTLQLVFESNLYSADVKFKFPENKSVWNIHEAEEQFSKAWSKQYAT